jgi:hypothetical protein
VLYDLKAMNRPGLKKSSKNCHLLALKQQYYLIRKKTQRLFYLPGPSWRFFQRSGSSNALGLRGLGNLGRMGYLSGCFQIMSSPRIILAGMVVTMAWALSGPMIRASRATASLSCGVRPRELWASEASRWI